MDAMSFSCLLVTGEVTLGGCPIDSIFIYCLLVHGKAHGEAAEEVAGKAAYLTQSPFIACWLPPRLLFRPLSRPRAGSLTKLPHQLPFPL